MINIRQLRQTALLGFITSFVLLAVKFIAYFLTGSKAVLSDAIESIINVVTGAFLMVSVSISATPVDKNHPYGHGKIEAFSAGLEGGLIILAGLMILIEAVPGFFSPTPPQNLNIGMILLFGAGIVNMLVGMYLLHSGKKLKSEAITADGRHLLTDFYTSAGVIIALILVRISGWIWLDPLVACLIAVSILRAGFKLISGSSKNLMNEADPEFLKRVVTGLNAIKKPGWLFPHKLRSIRSGRYHHVDLHISFPQYWPLHKVHAAEEELTKTLLKALGEEGDIMIHADPCEQAYCQNCDVDSCPERVRDSESNVEWTIDGVTSARPCSEDIKRTRSEE